VVLRLSPREVAKALREELTLVAGKICLVGVE
jgi:hypothetical protein